MMDMLECRHPSITRYSNSGQEPMLWACDDCKLRFYPACRECLIVGHRGEEHVDVLRPVQQR